MNGYIVMLSRDAKILENGSAVAKRMVQYGTLCDELRIVVFAKPILFQNIKQQLSENVWAYSPCNFFQAISSHCNSDRAYNGKWMMTTQDPFEVGFIGWLIKMVYGWPLEIQVHTDFLSQYFWQESCENKLRVIFAKCLVKQADRIRVVSERIKKSLAKLNIDENKIIVRPIEVDAKKISEAPIKINLHQKYPQFDFIILMASRFSREKNIELAISAFKNVVAKYSKVLLLIVGNGHLRKNYESRIKNYGLGENIIIGNWTEDIISYYKTVDLFLLTSNYEGYGMSVIEAKAAGCSIVMTDVGVAGYELKTGENIMIVPVNNQSALIEAITIALAKA